MHVLTLVHGEENVVSMFVVPIVLVFPCNDDGSPGCLSVLLQRHMQLEQVLGVLERTANMGCTHAREQGNTRGCHAPTHLVSIPKCEL